VEAANAERRAKCKELKANITFRGARYEYARAVSSSRRFVALEF
jgi:hypothetical protein